MQIFDTEIKGNSVKYSILNSLQHVSDLTKSDIEEYYRREMNDHYLGERLFDLYDRVVYTIYNDDESVFNSFIYGNLMK